MSHIFISYSHHDEMYRDALITGLRNEGIDYWADTGLEVGEAWREQIDMNLEEAFAVVVIVTNHSLQSSYVTYEWSWALGREIPVLPLFFEEIIVPIHDRLNAIQQQLKCYKEIRQEVYETIKRYQNQSPLVAYIELHISQLMLPLRYVVRTMTWLYSYGEDEQTFELITAISLIHSLLFFEYAELIRNKLPQLWLQNSHSFPRKEKRKFQQLTEQVDNLVSYFPLSDDRDTEQIFISLWKEKIEPVLRQFLGYDNTFYAQFDKELEKITTNGLPIYEGKTRALIWKAGQTFQGDFLDKSSDKSSKSLGFIFEGLWKEPLTASDLGDDDNVDDVYNDDILPE